MPSDPSRRRVHFETIGRDRLPEPACGRDPIAAPIWTPLPEHVTCQDCLRWLESTETREWSLTLNGPPRVYGPSANRPPK